MVGTSVTGPDGPVTDRGRRTRSRLLAAARQVFEDDGFLEARIVDIAETAGVSYGTFYTYFATKEEIFLEVARTVQQEVSPLAPGEVAQEELDLYTRLEHANRRYLEGYARNARMLAVIEQVATFNEELLQSRRDARVAFVDRSTRSIRRWQAEGLADPVLDPYYAASALGSMVDRFAYVWFVLGGEFELEKAVANLTRLWAHALQLEVPRRP